MYAYIDEGAESRNIGDDSGKFHPGDEVFHYQETEVKKLFAELWTKVKAK